MSILHVWYAYLAITYVHLRRGIEQAYDIIAAFFKFMLVCLMLLLESTFVQVPLYFNKLLLC